MKDFNSVTRTENKTIIAFIMFTMESNSYIINFYYEVFLTAWGGYIMSTLLAI